MKSDISISITKAANGYVVYHPFITHIARTPEETLILVEEIMAAWLKRQREGNDRKTV